jgi:excisionase family DNA binding protein
VVKQNLSPKELAEAFGVSESSLKRWADSGRIHAHRTVGGHRRIALAEAIRFARDASLPILRPDLLGWPQPATAQPPDRQLADLFFTLLRDGEAQQFRARVTAAYLQGHTLAELFDGPWRTALQRIGQLHPENDAGIIVAHHATDISLQCLNLLRSTLLTGREPDTQTPVALGGSPAGDHYLLPSLMAACILADTGFREINLGPDLPFPTFRAAAQHHHPRILWISCNAQHAAPSSDDLLALANDLAPQQTHLVVGGQFAPALPDNPPPNLHLCPTMHDLANLAQHLIVR